MPFVTFWRWFTAGRQGCTATQILTGADLGVDDVEQANDIVVQLAIVVRYGGIVLIRHDDVDAGSALVGVARAPLLSVRHAEEVGIARWGCVVARGGGREGHADRVRAGPAARRRRSSTDGR